MLPFTNNRERRKRPDRSGDPSTASSILLHEPQVPSRSQSSRRRPSNISSSSSHVPRLLSREIRNTAIKKACKQDLDSLAFFAELNGTVPTTETHERPSSPRTHNPPLPQKAEDTEALRNKNSTKHIIDDPVCTDCKNKIDKLEATINGTFIHYFNDPRFLFGDDMRAAQKALQDAKTTIRKASKRLDYHWSRQLAKRDLMWEAQVSLGQRIRKAYDDAMERKERMLDALMDGQVELGSQEMDELLGKVDPAWFEGEWEDM